MAPGRVTLRTIRMKSIRNGKIAVTHITCHVRMKSIRNGKINVTVSISVTGDDYLYPSF